MHLQVRLKSRSEKGYAPALYIPTDICVDRMFVIKLYESSSAVSPRASGLHSSPIISLE